MCFYDTINYQFEKFENDNNCNFNLELFNIESEIIIFYNKEKGYDNFVKKLDYILLKYIENNSNFDNIYLENINILKKEIIISYINSKSLNYYDDIIKIQTFNIND